MKGDNFKICHECGGRMERCYTSNTFELNEKVWRRMCVQTVVSRCTQIKKLQ